MVSHLEGQPGRILGGPAEAFGGQLVQADVAPHIPLADGTFNRVVAIYVVAARGEVLQFLREPDSLGQEGVRVLDRIPEQTWIVAGPGVSHSQTSPFSK